MSCSNQIMELSRDCIHVWRVSSAMDDQRVRELSKALSSEELVRADRFRFERDRRSFVVCRGTLRHLLAFYTGREASAIALREGAHGKPCVSMPSGLQFNVSHSHEIALLAFTLGQDVGVDVEYMRSGIDFLDLAEHSFSESERAAVEVCPSQDRADVFYRYWTCKEACIKADGRGLSVPLEQFSVVASHQGPDWYEVSCHRSIGLSPGMRIFPLHVGEEYAAAVAGTAPNFKVNEMVFDAARDDVRSAMPWVGWQRKQAKPEQPDLRHICREIGSTELPAGETTIILDEGGSRR